MIADINKRKESLLSSDKTMKCLMLNTFTPKKAGTPKRNEIVFISPSGEEIRNKIQLGQYLRSHPGGPFSSEFDWGSGDTPRRSARISEKIKAAETLEDEHPKKRGRISGSKKGTTQKNGVDEQVEDEAPESMEATTEALEGIEDPQRKDVEGGSLGGKEVDPVKTITEDSSKMDSNEGTKQGKDDVDAEVQDEASKVDKGQALVNVEDVDIKDAGDCSLNEGKVDSDEETKYEKDNIYADVENEAPEIKDVATRALESTEDFDMIDDVDGSVKEGKEVAAAEVIMDGSSSKVDSNEGNVDSVERTKQEKYEVGESVEDANLIDADDDSIKRKESSAKAIAEDSSAEVYSNDKPVEVDNAVKKDINQNSAANPAGKEVNDQEKQAQIEQRKEVTIISIPEASREENELERESQVESEALAFKAESYKDGLHGNEVEDKPMLNDKNEDQVSPPKSIPTANRVDLQSPQKASTIV